MKYTPSILGKWVGALAFASLASVSQAMPVNLVTDGGFETFGWTFSNTTVEASTDDAHGGALAGRYKENADASSGVISQTVLLDLNSTYELDFYVKGATGNITFSFPGLPTSVLDDEFDDTGSFFDIFFELENAQVADGWWHYSALFSGSAGGLLSFSFAGSGESSFLDDVTLVCSDLRNNPCRNSNPVPEPGSLFLMGVALAGVALARRRKSA